MLIRLQQLIVSWIFFFHDNKICKTYSYTAVSQHKEDKQKYFMSFFGFFFKKKQESVPSVKAAAQQQKQKIFKMHSSYTIREEDRQRIDRQNLPPFAPSPTQPNIPSGSSDDLTFDLLAPYWLSTGTEPPCFQHPGTRDIVDGGGGRNNNDKRINPSG